MKKEKFLKLLKKKLAFLNEKDRKKEILAYQEKIEKSKLSEEEAIRNLGSIQSIVEDIRKKYKIENKNIFRSFYDSLFDLASIFKNGDRNFKIKLLGDLLFLVVIVCVLKIPFIFIRNIGDNLITILFQNNLTILAVWGLVIEILYVLFALSFFVKTLKKWIDQLN